LEGQEAPEGRVCELRALPGNLVAWGSTPGEAVSKLQRTLELAFDHAGSAEKWYAGAQEQMSPKDRKDRQYYWEKVWKEGRPISGHEVPDADCDLAAESHYYEYVTILEPASAAFEEELELVK
jgi:hypothetical protein